MNANSPSYELPYDVVIAMPMYNEEDGIRGTLLELDQVFSARNVRVCLCLQDDLSTDDSISAVSEVAPLLKMNIQIEVNESNCGHGETLWRAYSRAINVGAPVVLQLDSDGQFLAKEVVDLYFGVMGGAVVVIGVRKHRVDPWFRILLTAMLRKFLRARYLGFFPDPNSPIRAYSTPILKQLFTQLSSDSLVPNIFLSIEANRKNLQTDFVSVSHQKRRGRESTGTMWKSSSNFRSLQRLLSFSIRAFNQLRRFRPEKI